MGLLKKKKTKIKSVFDLIKGLIANAYTTGYKLCPFFFEIEVRQIRTKNFIILKNSSFRIHTF